MLDHSAIYCTLSIPARVQNGCDIEFSDMSPIPNAAPFVPDDAPFTPAQRQWLNQFFQQHFAQGSQSALAPVVAVPATILYASQTGNAEGLAKKLAKLFKKNHIEATVWDVSQYDRSKLAQEKNLVVISSTYGDGEPPDSALEFHTWLHSDAAPRMETVRFAVLALGDTSYPDFCKCGIEFDQRLAALGAERMLDRVDCDVDYDTPFATWSQQLIGLLAPQVGAVAADSLDLEESGYSKKRPFPAHLLQNYNLNAAEAEKRTHHVAFSLADSGLEYEVGDALGVMPRNSEALVDELLSFLPFNTKVQVPLPDGGEASLRDALISHYDLRTLNKALIEKWQERSGSPFLRSLVEADDKAAYEKFMWGRELIDLVIDYPADFTDAEEFVGVLRKLQPRLYSIASSPKAHPGEVHLTVGVVNYTSHGRNRSGVCSNFLAHLSANGKAGVYVHSNPAFRLPATGETPVIMVGPGTGIAPFRAFLEERRATQATGENWLFFGNPYRSSDFLYEKELEALVADGVLHRLDTAFSRDQKQKIYVQDRMRENGAELWSWLERGAAFYVCGDASRMAKDVDTALHDVVATHGGLSSEQAVAYVQQLKKDKRYLRDVY